MPDCPDGNYVLIVDDDPDVCKILNLSFKHFGCFTKVVMRGQEALNAIQQKTPDLIMLDVRMPKMTGYEACRKLKENPDTREIPVVFLSAKGQEGEIEQGLASGAMEYIVKPFAPDELANQVKEILARQGKGF